MKKEEPTEKPGWDIISKYLHDEASPGEVEKVESWTAASDENRRDLEQNRQILEDASAYFQLKRFNVTAGWQKVQQQTMKTSSPSPQRVMFNKQAFVRLSRYAAMTLAVLLFGLLAYQLAFNPSTREIQSEIIPPGTFIVNEYPLPDGSVVTLNSNSKIRYPRQFKGKAREVTIEGEAFFDVAPDAGKPFVIHAGEAEIEAVGTSFCVSAFPEQGRVEVIVETGTVRITKNNDRFQNEPVTMMLHSGEKGIMDRKTEKMVKRPNDDPNYLAWKTHNLVFRETPLKQVAAQLKKVYHCDIELEEEKLNDLVLSAEFNQKPVDFILNVVQLTFDLELKKEKGHYILSEN